MNDIRIQDEGSIVLFHPITEQGENWLDEHCADAQRLGKAVVSEPRYVENIVHGMIEDGLKVG